MTDEMPSVVDLHAEPKGSNPQSREEVCWHVGSGKQVEKRDREVGSAINAWGLLGSGLRGIKTEPTGVEFSFANFLPLPCPVWKTVS
jgi:hypothetical protein